MVDTYNYLVTTNYYKPQLKYTAHKKSELKNIYKDILSVNKDSPLYMYKLTEQDQEFALSVKNYAKDIESALDDFLSDENVFSKSRIVSNNEDVVFADGYPDDDFEQFNININQLATPQANTGHALYTTATLLSGGTYKFNIDTKSSSYSFEYKTTEKSDNHSIQTGLVDFINKTNIGINATLGYDEYGSRSFIRLNSNTAGTMTGSDLNFDIYDTNTVNGRGIVNYFGLSHVTTFAKNAEFELDGTPFTTNSNEVELRNGTVMELKDITDSPVTIGLATDENSVMKALTTLQNEFNSFSQYVRESSIEGNGPKKIAYNLRSAYRELSEELEACGVSITRDGTMVIDEALARQAAGDGTLREAFTKPGGFANLLVAKTNLININPMEYINKTVVTYPNTQKPGTTNPYLTSVYSGMLFNYYC